MKNLSYISLNKAIQAQENGNAVIIDVREPAEFRDGHFPGAVNFPSTNFTPAAYQQWPGQQIILICQTGSRARTIAGKLEEAGIREVYVTEQHMEQIETDSSAGQGWSIDRQFRLTLGIFLLLFLIGRYWLGDVFWMIPLIIGLGLTITAIIDKCYLRVGIAKMPWNNQSRMRVRSLA